MPFGMVSGVGSSSAMISTLLNIINISIDNSIGLPLLLVPNTTALAVEITLLPHTQGYSA